MKRERFNYFKNNYFWNPEQKAYFQLRKTDQNHEFFFYQILRYWDLEEMIEFYEEDKWLLEHFIKMKKRILWERKACYLDHDKLRKKLNKFLRYFNLKPVIKWRYYKYILTKEEKELILKRKEKEKKYEEKEKKYRYNRYIQFLKETTKEKYQKAYPAFLNFVENNFNEKEIERFKKKVERNFQDN